MRPFGFLMPIRGLLSLAATLTLSLALLISRPVRELALKHR